MMVPLPVYPIWLGRLPTRSAFPLVGEEMSWRATAYIKTLTYHADGTRLTAREKLILFVLADYHHDDLDCCWPGIPKAANASLTSPRRFIELIKRMESKGTVRIERQSGRSNRYFFPGLTPVQSSHGSKKNPRRNCTPPVQQLPHPTRALHSALEPLENLDVPDIPPETKADLVNWCIEESHRTGKSADEIYEERKKLHVAIPA